MLRFFKSIVLSKLYIFNPAHDLALANGDVNYVPPAFAQRMAKDLALLALWLNGEPAAIYVPEEYESQSRRWLSTLDLPFKLVNEKHSLDFISSIEPWGWNLMLHNQLQTWKIAPEAILSEELIHHYIALSHRKYASKLLNELKKELPFASICGEMYCFSSFDELQDYINQQKEVVLKEPYSCSGKGLRWIHGKMNAAEINWAKKVMKQQHGIMAEPIYQNQFDLAFEFKANEVAFSCFETINGAYNGNKIASNEQLNHDIQAFLSPELLNTTIQTLQNLLPSTFTGYKGPLGIDAMVVQMNASTFLHPCVEVNLRHTMGELAQSFYKYYAFPNTQGTFYLKRFASSAALKGFDEQKKQQMKQPSFVSGKWCGGYFPLVPIHDEMLYLAWVE